MKISVGVHNLSTSRTEVLRTGISHVVFNILREVLKYDGDDFEFYPIFRMPITNFADTPFYEPAHFNATKVVLEKTLAELGYTKEDIIRRWPYTAEIFSPDYDRANYENHCLETIAKTDLFFEVSLHDIRNVIDGARRINPRLKCGVCVHDLGPVKYPEFVNFGMEEWFGKQYMECLRYVDFSISVSRHTALDLGDRQHIFAKSSNRLYYAALPSPEGLKDAKESLESCATVNKFPDIQSQNYICSVATLEPRKNLSYLVEGFWSFRRNFPEAAKDLHLVLVGSQGWKNQALISLIKKNPQNIILTGYVSNEDLNLLYANALALVMPSHYEGFGLPIAQAREAGVPVITCANSSMPEASGLDAIYVRPWLPDELGCAIRQVQRLKDIKQNRARIASPTEGWRDLFSHWRQVFKEVLVRDNYANARFRRKCRAVVGLDVSESSVFRQLRLKPSHDAWFAPRLYRSQDPVENLSAFDERSLLINNGVFTELKSSLYDSGVFVLASPTRLEAIGGLDIAINNGMKLIVCVNENMIASPDFEQFKRGVERWASLIVCSCPQVKDAIGRDLDDQRIVVDREPFARVLTGEWEAILANLFRKVFQTEGFHGSKDSISAHTTISTLV